MDNKHDFFMNIALEEAHKAFDKAEVPVGAVITQGEKIISQAHNLRENQQNPLGHAEILAIQSAGKKLNSWRLEDCSLYVSLEPCLMCMGAIVQARLSHLIYACSDPKAGFSSYYGIDKLPSWKHKIEITSGIADEQSSLLLKKFFQKLRAKD